MVNTIAGTAVAHPNKQTKSKLDWYGAFSYIVFTTKLKTTPHGLAT